MEACSILRQGVACTECDCDKRPWRAVSICLMPQRRLWQLREQCFCEQCYWHYSLLWMLHIANILPHAFFGTQGLNKNSFCCHFGKALLLCGWTLRQWASQEQNLLKGVKLRLLHRTELITRTETSWKHSAGFVFCSMSTESVGNMNTNWYQY